MTRTIQASIDTRGVARVTLDRPERRNAFDGELVRELHAAIMRLGADRAVRVIVLAGAGETFCAGADLTHMRKMAAADAAANQADALELARMLAALDAVGKPTIARVHGDAFGGGIGLIACCDIAVAAPRARFALSEARLGILPATIAPFVLSAIGARAFRRFALTGERFGAEQARALGLVHEIATDDDIDGAVETLIDELLRAAPGAQAEVKALVAELAAPPAGLSAAELTSRRLARVRLGDEAREGFAAFLERRKPAWTPRS